MSVRSDQARGSGGLPAAPAARSPTRRRRSGCAARRRPSCSPRPAVAIVGARACSSYGRSVARSLGRELAAAGLVVVSGMARGIDGEAHRGALDVGGITVAVLGCGIDRDYPAAHRDLAGRIVETGLIVSEYEPGVEPAPWRFPARNRIIAGLCAATVVVEARERSRRADHGGLRARGRARGDGRARRDHLGRLGRVERAAPARRDAGDGGRRRARGVRDRAGGRAVASREGLAGDLLRRLADGAASIDELARAAGVAPGEVAAALIELELAGRVDESDGVYRATVTR